MQAAVVRPKVSICSVHKVAKRNRIWSHQVYKKAVQLEGSILLEACDCPYCLSLVSESFKKQFPAMYA
ncbi:MAG TPA: hypothetical protein VIH59_30085 [Candidatus Tectomicrobia bacterium]|jgi:hypothetical protein